MATCGVVAPNSHVFHSIEATWHGDLFNSSDPKSRVFFADLESIISNVDNHRFNNKNCNNKKLIYTCFGPNSDIFRIIKGFFLPFYRTLHIDIGTQVFSLFTVEFKESGERNGGRFG